MAEKFRIEGLKELDQALSELKKSTSRNVLQRAGTQILEPVMETARSLVRKNSHRTGRLEESLAVSTRLSRRSGRQVRSGVPVTGRAQINIHAGVDVRKFAGVSPAPHAHLVEFGTGPRTTKDGKFTGSMPPSPFIRPAWDLHKTGMTADVGNILRAEIEKTVARAQRRAAARAARGG